MNYRPEFTINGITRPTTRSLRLDPLGTEGGEEMLQALLDDGAELLPLKRVIIEKTEGNPFFMEEIVRSLFEQEALLRNGSIKTRETAKHHTNPLHRAGGAGLAHRPPARRRKELLQTLAVIGKEFTLRLINVAPPQFVPRLQALLAALQAGDFIYEEPQAGESNTISTTR